MTTIVRSVRLSPATQAAVAWLDARSVRERRLIIGLTALAVIAIVWYGVLQPILHARESATVRIETAAQLSARLNSAAPRGPTAVETPVAGQMADILRQRAVAFGLSADRIEPEADGAGIVIENGRYDSIIRFIAAVEGVDGGVVQDLQIDRGNAPGMVRLQMRVRQT